MPENATRLLGYARVSTVGQTLAAQLDQLRAAGCKPIYQEKISGACSDRKQLAAILRGLQPGDVVTVTAIDRLARSVFDLFAIVKRIEDAGAVFRSLREPWADTTTATGRMMVAVMGGMADVEREIIYTRTQEGRARAKARGVKLGRRPKLTPEQRRQMLAQLAAGTAPADLARTYGVSWQTIQREKKRAASPGYALVQLKKN